jgi:hypothetical protein
MIPGLLQVRLLGIPLHQASFLWQQRRRLDCFPELLVFTWRMLDTNEHFLVCPLRPDFPTPHLQARESY